MTPEPCGYSGCKGESTSWRWNTTLPKQKMHLCDGHVAHELTGRHILVHKEYFPLSSDGRPNDEGVIDYLAAQGRRQAHVG